MIVIKKPMIIPSMISISFFPFSAAGKRYMEKANDRSSKKQTCAFGATRNQKVRNRFSPCGMKLSNSLSYFVISLIVSPVLDC